MTGREKLYLTKQMWVPMVLCGVLLGVAGTASGAQQTTAQTAAPAATAPATFPGALMKLPAGPPPPMAKPFVAAPTTSKPGVGPLLPSPQLKPTPGGGVSKSLQK